MNTMYLTKQISTNIKYIDDLLKIDESFDIGKREFNINSTKITCYYVTGLCSSEHVTFILESIFKLNNNIDKNILTSKLIENFIAHQQIEKTNKYDNLINYLLSGLFCILIDNFDNALCIDVRQYPGRSPSEPDTEKVVRGSRDGFTENIIINTALTRRRVKDKNLRVNLYQIGNRTKTDVALLYIEDMADINIVKEVKSKIEQLDVDELIMADKHVEEIIFKQGIHPYPKVRYTERPDILAKHLYQGYVGIIVDTSPSIIIAPVTFFDHMSHAEEYRQVPIIGTFLRLVRFIGIGLSLILVPTWFLFSMHPELLPESLSFIGPKEKGSIPLIIQLVIGELGMEFLRMAAIHTPSSLSTAMGIIAGILVGQIAIDVGLFSPEVVLYVALSGIGSFVTPSYELSLANKFSKIIFLISTYFFGLIGLLSSVSIWFIYLSSIQILGKGYMSPIIPFSFRNLKKLIFRGQYKNKRK